VAVLLVAVALVSPAAAAAKTRTLSLYFVHTKESLTVTYRKNGRYIPSAMKKLNHFLRDWRHDKATRMSPKTIDLMWELHADLGSRQPIHIISGYRSPKTNAMLRRIGRKVARRSRHMTGQAIDLYFPDVPTSRLRNSALVRKSGGVGYYPRSGVKGFVHIDSGSVRHWPRISKTRMAKIFRDYRSTVGARHNRKGTPAVMVASSGPTSITPKQLPRTRSVVVAKADIPTPRPRPMEVLMAAAAVADDLQITPASAPVPSKNFGARPATVIRDIYAPATASLTGMIERTLQEDETTGQASNRSAKGSFADAIRNGTTTATPIIRPLVTAEKRSEDDERLWWPMRLFSSGDSLFRRDGAPQPFVQDAAVASMSTDDEAALKRMIASLTRDSRMSPSTTISAKGDRLTVNRSGKGDLIAPAALPVMKRQSMSGKSDPLTALTQRVADTAILRGGARPLVFD
jgi:uncharacterized protein YcbK (DUF882 family)